MGVSDYNGSSVTNAITIARNGSNINGEAADLKLNKTDRLKTLFCIFKNFTFGKYIYQIFF